MKETEQTLLDQIKDQVAKEQYCTGWKHLSHKYPSSIDAKFWPIVCERYATAKAKASCEATLKKASENAKHIIVPPYTLDKSSITDKDNIVIL